MGLTANQAITDIQLDRVFIGSCTNSRIEDLRAAAVIAKGRKVASTIKQAIVVPGSGLVKAQAEAEGLDKTLPEGKIVVRPAAAGETVTTLDGIERILPAGALVIADRDHPSPSPA